MDTRLLRYSEGRGKEFEEFSLHLKATVLHEVSHLQLSTYIP